MDNGIVGGGKDDACEGVGRVKKERTMKKLLLLMALSAAMAVGAFGQQAVYGGPSVWYAGGVFVDDM